VDVYLKKEDETADRCVYAFGDGPEGIVGRLALDKSSGDVEILSLDDASDPPGEPFYLARVVPKLHALHDAGTYPDVERWAV
jgi:hypothetical protein